MNTAWTTKLSTLALTALFAATGCSGDNTTDAGDTGTTQDVATDTQSNDVVANDVTAMDSTVEDTSVSDTGTADTATGDTGSSDASGPSAACVTYCTTIMTNCTGANAQFVNMDACLGSCRGIPADTAMSGNTIGCHSYHATAAATGAAVHCPHAGPTGADVCGSPCENFCAIAMSSCTGSNSQFTSVADCMTACSGFATTPAYSTSTTSGNSYACRLYHLTVASSSDSMATVHCGHIVTNSPVCQ